MVNEKPITFGRTRVEQFSYLIITGMFIAIFYFLMPYLAMGLLNVYPDYYEENKLFYQLCAYGAGFLIAQIYIRIHTNKVRGVGKK